MFLQINYRQSWLWEFPHSKLINCYNLQGEKPDKHYMNFRQYDASEIIHILETMERLLFKYSFEGQHGDRRSPGCRVLSVRTHLWMLAPWKCLINGYSTGKGFLWRFWRVKIWLFFLIGGWLVSLNSFCYECDPPPLLVRIFVNTQSDTVFGNGSVTIL